MKQRNDELFQHIIRDMNCDPLLKGDGMTHGRVKSFDDMLVFACYAGRLDIATFCISNNADDSTNGALMFAVEQGHADIITLLMETYDYAFPLLIKAKKIADDQDLTEISSELDTQIFKKSCLSTIN